MSHMCLRCYVIIAVQSPSHVWLFATPWTAVCQAPLSLIISWSLPKFMSIASVMPSNPLNLCHSLLLLPSVFPRIRIFSNESTLCIRWPKYWSFSFSISPSDEYWFPLGLTRLISLKSKGLPRVFSSTTIQNHQFFGAQSSLWSNSHTHTLLLEKPWLLFCFVFHILKSICLVSVSIHQKISFIRIGTWSFSSQHLGSCPAWWDN